RRAREERQGAAGSQLLGLASGFRVNESLFSGLGLAGQAANMFKPPDFSHQLPALAIRPPNVTLIEANRYDDLVAIAVRASQRVEDLEEELRRLRQQHADVVKPDARLWWAVAILTAYAIAGVAVPLWVMSYGPTSLS